MTMMMTKVLSVFYVNLSKIAAACHKNFKYPPLMNLRITIGRGKFEVLSCFSKITSMYCEFAVKFLSTDPSDFFLGITFGEL